MRSFFSYDSKVNQIMTRVYEYMLLSLFWLISSVPILTIGASTVTLRIALKNSTISIEECVRIFKNEFVQATKLWLPLFSLQLFLFFNLYVINVGAQKNLFFYFLRIAYLVLLGILFLTFFMAVTKYKEGQKVNTAYLASCLVTMIRKPLSAVGVILVSIVGIFVLYLFPVSIFVIPSLYINAVLKLWRGSDTKKTH